jgi:hypothetical protein
MKCRTSNKRSDESTMYAFSVNTISISMFGGTLVTTKYQRLKEFKLKYIII